MLLVHETALRGHLFHLQPLEKSHIPSLWPCLSEKGIERLFRFTYGRDCASLQDLETLLIPPSNDEGSDNMAASSGSQASTYTIFERTTGRPVGWTTVELSAADPQIVWTTLYTPRARSWEIATDVYTLVSKTAFGELNATESRLRTGRLEDELDEGVYAPGINIIVIVGTDLNVPSPNAELVSDYVLPAAKWSLVKQVFDGWLQSVRPSPKP